MKTSPRNYLPLSNNATAAYVQKVFLVLFSFLPIQLLSAQPLINSFTPALGPVGTTVIITGNGFDPSTTNNIVYFGAAKATVSTASATQLSVIVPAGATHQPITITVNKLTACSAQPFVITFQGGTQFNAASFASPVKYNSSGNSPTNGNPNFIVPGDLDGDNKADLIVLNNLGNTIAMFKNTSSSGSLSFFLKNETAVRDDPRSFATGDLNGDGALDIVAANFNNNSVSIIKNANINGIWGINLTTLSIVTHPVTVSIADIDGDGKQDLIVDNDTLSIFRNSGSDGLTFDPKADLLTGPGLQFSIADMDGDKKPDIMVANTANNTISILKNTSVPGSISFNTKVDLTTGPAPNQISTGDIDGDGFTDLIISYSQGSNALSVYRNLGITGIISFAAGINISTADTPSGISIADVDGDGRPDVVTSNPNTNDISIFKNISNVGVISFAAYTNYAVNATQPQHVVAADLDGDGKPEIAVANYSGNSISVFKNKINGPGITSFTPAAAGWGQSVTITGTNFTGTTAVSFGGVATTSFSVVSPTTITAIVSSGASGSVSVTTPGETTSLAGFTFLPPVITSFTPGIAGSGTTVTITGTNLSGATSVTFGGIPASSFTVVSATSITAVVSTGASGSVSVITPGGTTTKTGFTFVPKPLIISFTPLTAKQGDTVTISGKYFTGVTSVTFGITAASSFTVASDSTINAIIGNGSSGNVTVIEPGGTAFKTGFTFIAAPIITSFNPLTAKDGDTITISGKYFTGATSVTFGGTAASSFSVASDSTITAIVGTGASGNIAVVAAGGSASLGTFTYSAPVTVTNFYPKANSTDLSQTSNWTSDVNGGAGTSPLNFTSANQLFTINDNILHAIVNGVWLLSGGSNVIVNNTNGLVFNPGGSLIIGRGSDVNFNNKNVILKSDTTGTASIGTISGALSNASNVTVERYISDRRAWRLLGIPFAISAQSIKEAWMENGNNAAGYGTQITTFKGDPNAINFDGENLTSSIRIYKANAFNSDSVHTPNTLNNIVANPAYFLYIRGDRFVDRTPSGTISSPTVLRITGNINQGVIMGAGDRGSSFSLVQNPYPSVIDFDEVKKITGNSTIDRFYVLDPTLGVSGQFRTIDITGTAPNYTYTATPGGEDNSWRFIESGAAFFIPGNAVVNFTEAVKSYGNAPNSMFRVTDGNETEMNINLNVVNQNNTISLADGIRKVFNDNYSASINNEDAKKISGFDMNFGIFNKGEVLSVDKGPLPAANDVIALKIWNIIPGNYQFEIQPAHFPAQIYTAYLQDNYLNTKTPVDLNKNTLVNFTVSADAGSASENRFIIVFIKTALINVSSEPGIKIFPNPIQNGIIKLHFNNMPAGNYAVRVINSLTQDELIKYVNHPGGSAVTAVTVKKPKGVYIIEIRLPDEIIKVEKIIIR